MEKNKIFISHRHSDTQSDCHRLKSDLQEHFGKDNVFLDIENLEPGINFADAIEKALGMSKVVLVVIGPDWFGPEDDQGIKRLFQPNDWVRREVAAALKSDGTRVIPILMKKASEPQESNLPDDLKPLAGLQATEITIKRWDYDVGELIKVVERIVPKVKKPEPQSISESKPHPKTFVAPPKPKSWWAKNFLWVLGSVVFFMVLVGMCMPDEEVSNGTEQPTALTEEEVNNARENNPEGTEIYENLTPTDPNSSKTNQETQVIPDLNGYWILKDYQGNQSTLFFSQNGNKFEFVEYNILNVQIGQGSGEIVNNQLNSEYYNSLFEVNGSISMRTENNGKTWEGQVSIPAAGTSSQISLTRN